MTGGTLILMARRRAQLTQRELAERVGCRQATIARWERGDRQPSYQDVWGAVSMCGLHLDAHLEPEDRSWWPQIASQLASRPSQRVRRLTPSGAFDAIPALEVLADSGAPAIVIGEIAGALHGWPLVLGGDALEICARAQDRSITAALEQLDARPGGESEYSLASAGRIKITEVPPGTGGFVDLARDAETFEVSGQAVRVASLLDLLRVADASPQPEARREALAYGAVLDVERARRRPPAADHLSDEERIREWLSHQTPAA